MKIATVCSGIGSPEQALIDLGVEHEITFACEIDKYARQTYLANYSPGIMLEDLTKEEWIGEQFQSDIFIGGIPCQAFSLAGKRLGELDKRGLLFYDFYRYVKNQQPKVFIIENVKGLLSDAGGKTFQNWIQLLGRSLNTHVNMFNHEDSLLYNLHFKVLNSKDFGVPQNRERVFIVGIRNDLPNEFRFPVGERLTVRLKDVLEESVDEKYYLSDKAIQSIINNSDNLQKSSVNPEIANTLQSPGNACGIYKGANFIDDKTLLSNSALNRKFEMRELVPPLRSHDGCGHDNYINEINNKDGLTQYGTSQDTKLSPLNGLSQSLGSGHFNQPKVIISGEPQAGRITGRNPENPKSRVAGQHTERMLEINDDSSVINTLTTVQKDNVIVEPELRQVAQMEDFESEGRVYDSAGLARTIKDGGGGGAKTGWYAVDKVVQLNPSKESGGVQPYQHNPVYDGHGLMTTLDTDSGRKSVLVNDVRPVQIGKSEQFQATSQIIGREGQEAHTIPATQPNGVAVNQRIRRLTPLECFRLQGYPDTFNKPVSDSQLYKQAGNSITVNVMKAILQNVVPIIRKSYKNDLSN